MAIDPRIRSNIWSRTGLTRGVLCFFRLPSGSSQYTSHGGTAKGGEGFRSESAENQSDQSHGKEGTINRFIRHGLHFSTILERMLLRTFGMSSVPCTRKKILGYFCVSLYAFSNQRQCKGGNVTYRATSRPPPRQTTALVTLGNLAMVRVMYSGVILYRPKLASVTVITNQSS